MFKLLLLTIIIVLHLCKVNCQELTVRPENTTAASQDSVELKCVFSEPVYCRWQRNGLPITIPNEEDGYLYSNRPNPFEKGADCSIRISSMTEPDFARWRCATLGTNTKPSVAAPEIWISKQEKYLEECYSLGKHIAIALCVTCACLAILLGIYYYLINSARNRILGVLVPRSSSISSSAQQAKNNDNPRFSITSAVSVKEPDYLIPVQKNKDSESLLNNSENTSNALNSLQNEDSYLKLL